MTNADPIAQLAQWLKQAEGREAVEPAAMSVATVGADGRPALRMVLLRGMDACGLVFYTNLTSRKAEHLRANPWVALCLHWKSMGRRYASKGAPNWSVTPRPMPISRLVRASHKSARGLRNNPIVWKGISRLKDGWPSTPPSSLSAPCRVRRSGPAIEWHQSTLSSGKTARSDSTTAPNGI